MWGKDITIKGKMNKTFRRNNGCKQWNVRVGKNFQSMTEDRNHKGTCGYPVECENWNGKTEHGPR